MSLAIKVVAPLCLGQAIRLVFTRAIVGLQVVLGLQVPRWHCISYIVVGDAPDLKLEHLHCGPVVSS
jgi:hypothetical protein